jgi:hypothetical protein
MLLTLPSTTCRSGSRRWSRVAETFIGAPDAFADGAPVVAWGGLSIDTGACRRGALVRSGRALVSSGALILGRFATACAAFATACAAFATACAAFATACAAFATACAGSATACAGSATAASATACAGSATAASATGRATHDNSPRILAGMRGASAFRTCYCDRAVVVFVIDIDPYEDSGPDVVPVPIPVPVMRAMVMVVMRTAHKVDLSISGRVCEQGAGGCGDHQPDIGACLLQHVGLLIARSALRARESAPL